MSKGKGEIDQVFEHHLAGGKQAAMLAGISIGGWSFQDHRIVLPLQAADILAWETLWHMQKVVLPKEADKKPHRRSYSALLGMPHEEAFHDQESIRRLVQHWKAKRKLPL